VSLQFRPFLAILVLLSVPLAKAQTGSSDSSQSASTGSSQSGSTDSSPQDQSSNGPQPVYTHPESTPKLGFLDEVTSHNYIKLGMAASVSYDTNAAAFSEQSYSQTQGIFSPFIQLTQTRPKLTWDVSAFGGLTTSNAPGYSTTSNPYLQAGLLYQISQRWQLNLSESYLYASDPFQLYTAYRGLPTFNQPNPTTYSPLATTQANNAYLDLTYQMTAHDSLTFTGTENFSQYQYNGSSSSSLSSSPNNWYGWGGVAQYQHVFSPRLSAGGSYSFNAVDYGSGTSRSGIQSMQGFVNYEIGPHMTVTGWIGPQYTSTKSKVPIFCSPFGCFIEIFHNSSWSNAWGGNFKWIGQRNYATVNFSKGVTSGGILQGIVELYQVRGSYTRQLSPRWSANVNGLYGNNSGYSTFLHAQKLTSFTGYAGLTRQLTPALSATMQYVYFYESQKNLIGAAAPKWINNRFQFTLQYSWGHSLGR
jgi:hypothetical protein